MDLPPPAAAGYSYAGHQASWGQSAADHTTWCWQWVGLAVGVGSGVGSGCLHAQLAGHFGYFVTACDVNAVTRHTTAASQSAGITCVALCPAVCRRMRNACISTGS